MIYGARVGCVCEVVSASVVPTLPNIQIKRRAKKPPIQDGFTRVLAITFAKRILLLYKYFTLWINSNWCLCGATGHNFTDS